ncbi:MAG: hypothetical protein J6M17_04030 [Ruminococcus sp.]|nr:hypothetical protein [Ruminococcus sp.]
MKKLLSVAAAAVMLAGCGDTSPADRTKVTAAECPDIPESVTSAEKVPEKTETADAVSEQNGGDTGEIEGLFDILPDDELIKLYFSGGSTENYVQSYFRPSVRADSYETVFVPVSEDFDEWTGSTANFAPDAESTKVFGENEIYTAYKSDYGNDGVKTRVIPRDFRIRPDGTLQYTGEMTAKAAERDIDILTRDELLIARNTSVTDSGDISYDYLSLKADESSAELYLTWKSYVIRKADCGMQKPCEPSENGHRTIHLNGDSGNEVSFGSDSRNGVQDIELRASRDSLLTNDEGDENRGCGAGEVLFYAEVSPDGEYPERVEFIDADTGDTVGMMADTARFTEDGDDIKGDCVFSIRITYDMDIDTDPDVSDRREFRYYARYTDSQGVKHVSRDIVSLTLYEPFTEKELSDLRRVSDAVKELCKSKKYKKADADRRAEMAVELLNAFADEGIIDRDSIGVSESHPKNVVYRMSTGVTSVIEVEEHDDRCN